MVQILNKMVHLQYPILEIWCCPKHIYQLPSSRLKFDTKLRKVFPNNLAAYIALLKSFLQAKYSTQCCLFVLANQMRASKTQIFGYLWHWLLVSKAFFKAQMWQKAEEYVPKMVCQHSTAQVIVTGKMHRVLHVMHACI